MRKQSPRFGPSEEQKDPYGVGISAYLWGLIMCFLIGFVIGFLQLFFTGFYMFCRCCCWRWCCKKRSDWEQPGFAGYPTFLRKYWPVLFLTAFLLRGQNTGSAAGAGYAAGQGVQLAQMGEEGQYTDAGQQGHAMAQQPMHDGAYVASNSNGGALPPYAEALAAYNSPAQPSVAEQAAAQEWQATEQLQSPSGTDAAMGETGATSSGEAMGAGALAAAATINSPSAAGFAAGHAVLAPAPFTCTCDNSSSASLGNPVALPGDLVLHPWSGYETVWYIGQVITAESPARRFGVLWMLYSGASSDGMCPSATTGAWAALAVPDTQSTEHHHKRNPHSGRRHASFSSGPAPGSFIQDSRLAPSMQVSTSPFAMWDAPNQWGLRQLATSNDWQLMNMSVQAVDQGFAFDLQLNASVVAMQAMGLNGVAPDTCVQHRGQPRIAATGTVTLGSELLSVTGTIWSQHMWGISPAGTSRSWRWYNAELSDGWSAQFVFFDAPSSDASYGNLISPDGSKNIALSSDLIELTQDPASVWVSPRSGRAYNTSSTISIPSYDTILHYQTWIADNEVLITPGSTLPLFYEGVSDVQGTHQGASVSGNGYTERFNPGGQETVAAAATAEE